MTKLLLTLLIASGIGITGLSGYAIHNKLSANSSAQVQASDSQVAVTNASHTSANASATTTLKVNGKIDVKQTETAIKEMDNAAESLNFNADLSTNDLGGF